MVGPAVLFLAVKVALYASDWMTVAAIVQVLKPVRC
jgi:hypothetical protein